MSVCNQFGYYGKLFDQNPLREAKVFHNLESVLHQCHPTLHQCTAKGVLAPLVRGAFFFFGGGQACQQLICKMVWSFSSYSLLVFFSLFYWRVPIPPCAKPLVAERASWRSPQSCVTGGQQPIGNPYRLLSFLLHTWQPLCDPNSHSWGRLFQLPGGLAPGGLGTRRF